MAVRFVMGDSDPNPGDRSHDPEPHHALTNPAENPDPTEWPDPYERRSDPRTRCSTPADREREHKLAAPLPGSGGRAIGGPEEGQGRRVWR